MMTAEFVRQKHTNWQYVNLQASEMFSYTHILPQNTQQGSCSAASPEGAEQQLQCN